MDEPYVSPQELLKQVDTASRIYGSAGALATTREQEIFQLLLKLAKCVAELDKQMNGAQHGQ